MAKKRQPPVSSEFTVTHGGGSMEFGKFISKNQVRVGAIEVPPRRFDSCPICLTPDPDHEEHVPPESLGGKVMTWTCQRCNNDFGTAEEELRCFLELEIKVQAEATRDGPVRGKRGATVALRSAPGRPPGAFVRSSAPEFADVLASGSSELRVTPLDMDRVRAAALKQAYLSACLLLGGVPNSPAVERVRSILLAARDRDTTALASGLTEEGVELPGWIEAEGAAPVLLVEPSDEVPDWLFAFAGRFTMPWPFADLRVAVESDDPEVEGM